jgi:hypothetical protein
MPQALKQFMEFVQRLLIGQAEFRAMVWTHKPILPVDW